MQTLGPILIGVGNPFRRDDEVGWEVLRRLRGKIPPGVRVLEETGDGAELLEAWKGADWVILVDAIRSGAPPGTIHKLAPRTKRLPTWFSHASTHSFGVAEAIELARSMGELPAELVVYGVEGFDFSSGTELSPDVAKVVPVAADLILREIRQLLVACSTPGA